MSWGYGDDELDRMKRTDAEQAFNEKQMKNPPSIQNDCCSGFCNGSCLNDDPEPESCECDNENDTVCRWCWARGRRKSTDPEVTSASPLRPEGPEYWEELSGHPIAEWKDEVLNDRTRLGYRQWIGKRNASIIC